MSRITTSGNSRPWEVHNGYRHESRLGGAFAPPERSSRGIWWLVLALGVVGAVVFL